MDESRYANRDPSHYRGAAWQEFASEIAASDGNVQAVLVRPKSEGRFEIVFGHRRRQACLEAGLPLLAVIADGVGDLLLFKLMERENRSRVDLSPYEQGLSYAKALRHGLFPSLRQLAAAIGRDAGLVSRYIAITELPVAVLDAFSARPRIQKRWGEVLSALFQQDPTALVAHAEQLATEVPRPSDSEIFRRLCGLPAPLKAESVVVKNSKGRTVATVRRKSLSCIEITVAGPLTEQRFDQLLDVLKRP